MKTNIGPTGERAPEEDQRLLYTIAIGINCRRAQFAFVRLFVVVRLRVIPDLLRLFVGMTKMVKGSPGHDVEAAANRRFTKQL